MAKLSNNTNIPLSVAVLLASNSYDFKPNAKSLSATDFNRSVRQVILRNRAGITDNADLEPTDIATLVKSKNGTAIHDAIEKVWLNKNIRDKAMKDLGYPQSVIDRIVVNPDPATLKETDVPVYMEIRKSIEIDGYTISGKFDFVAEGSLTDFKSTGTFTYEKQTNSDKYKVQGSIYRLIHEDIIDKDFMTIVFWFTDWNGGKAKASPKYPQSAVLPQKIELMTKEETYNYMRQFISQVELHQNTPEPDLPECTQEDLWQGAPVYKYYRDPNKRSRATANFDDMYSAQQRYIKDGGTGIIVTVPGKAKACNYCSAASVCTQRQRLIAEGTLDLE